MAYNYQSPLSSPEDVELNRAIYESLRSVNQPPQTEYVPVQTTTYIPIPTPQQTTTILPSIAGSSVTPVTTNRLIQNVPIIPNLPRLGTTTTGIPLPITRNVPLTQVHPIVPTTQSSTRDVISSPTYTVVPTTQTVIPSVPVLSTNQVIQPRITTQTLPSYIGTTQQLVNQPVLTQPVLTSPTRSQTVITQSIPQTFTTQTVVPRPVLTQTIVPRPVLTQQIATPVRSNIQIPISPPTNLPPIQPITLNGLINSPTRSPGKMTDEEQRQLQQAILSSFRQSPVTTTLPRNPNLSPTLEDDYDTNVQAAINASIRANNQANLAAYYANQVNNIPLSPTRYTQVLSPPVSPRTLNLQENRLLRQEQDIEYQQALRIDQERAENARLAAEAAAAAAAASEEAARKLQEAKAVEQARIGSLLPPILQYPIEVGDPRDIYIIRFRLPTGDIVTHAFNKNEPFNSVIQQIRFDIKYLGDLTFSIAITQPPTEISCSPEKSISDCGIQNRVTINVAYV